MLLYILCRYGRVGTYATGRCEYSECIDRTLSVRTYVASIVVVVVVVLRAHCFPILSKHDLAS